MSALHRLVARIALLRFAAAAAAAALAASACTGESSPGAAVSPGDAAGPADPVERIMVSEFDVPRAMLDAHRSRMTPAEQEMFRDGVITVAEYEAARLEEVRCLRERGFEIEAPATISRAYSYVYVAKTGPEGPPPGALAECTGEGAASVLAMIWADVTAPLAAEAIQESRVWMRDCLQAAGVDVSLGAWEKGDTAARTFFLSCLREMQALFGFGEIAFGVEGAPG